MTEAKHTCSTCRFCEAHGNGDYRPACHRYPPQPGPSGYSRFPDAKEWCGEHQPQISERVK